MKIYQEQSFCQFFSFEKLKLKDLIFGLCFLLLTSPAALAKPSSDRLLQGNEEHLQGQVPSVQQFSDVRPTDWAYEALQSLVQRYGCLAGYPDNTFRGDNSLTRYEFAASLNSCLDTISESIADNSIQEEDMIAIERLQAEFEAELVNLGGRVDELEARTGTLEDEQFSTTTKLKAQIITVFSDTFGNSVGGDDDETEAFFANRGRLNFESSFTGKDLLRVRLQFGNFFDDDGNSQIASTTGTGMTRLNFDTDSDNDLSISQVRYYFPVIDSIAVAVGPTGIGYTDITTTVTPATIDSDDGNGVPSLFGQYDPIFRRGGGGVGINWNFTDKLTLTAGYLADNPDDSSSGNGLFNGGYNALAHLTYIGDAGGVGLAYSHGYTPEGEVDITGGTGSELASSPFGDTIDTSNDIASAQAFYQFSDNFQVHAWGGYMWATAENSGTSSLDDGTGDTTSLLVDEDDEADSWYGAIGVSFPDVGGEGNLPGIIFGVPPHVIESDVLEEDDNAYHIEAFYRWRLNDNISVTPGAWAVLNPENNSDNDTQYVGVFRTTFDF